MGRNRCNNGVWRRDSTASAPRSPPRVPRARPRRRRRAPRRARTGSSAARTSPRTPPTAPQWQESGYLGRCIFKGSFSEAQCKDMGRQYPRRPGRVQVRGERRQVRHESEGPGVFVEQAVLRGDGVAPHRGGSRRRHPLRRLLPRVLVQRAEKVASAKRQVHHNEKVQASQRGVQVASDWRQVLLGKVRQRPLRADE